jgi:hypothetical protein
MTQQKAQEKRYPRRLFRKKYTGELVPGELVWKIYWPDQDTVYGPYLVKAIDDRCPGQVYVQIVGKESAGWFGMPWGTVMVPRYR